MLELRGITKRFGAFTALNGVDFAVRGGEIVGLLGENGAGKSTLLSLIGGVLSPTAGQILWDATPVRFASPREATGRGIGVVHQHFMLVPDFTVAENIALHSLEAGAIFGARTWATRVEAWAHSLGWQIDGMRRVADLSVGERQRVEILKALFAHSDPSSAQRAPARLLLLDEPTANLTPLETGELFRVLRHLREAGRGVVLVSHKLQEVLSLCDRVVVLRQGRLAGERRTHDTDPQQLASLMVGQEVKAHAPVRPAMPAATNGASLVIENLTCGTLRDFSLTVRRGEIVGLAGVAGNGQNELIEVLNGLRQPDAGRFSTHPAGALAIIPQDRQLVGLILPFDLAENMALQPVLRAECRKGGGFDWSHARRRTHDLMQRFNVRAPATAERTPASHLSGGNQQKLIIARALSFPHTAVVAADPTRGLDIAATQFIHTQLRAAAAESGVLLISTDLDEVLELSDRVGVLYEGRLLPDHNLLPRGTGRESIGALMGGASGGSRQKAAGSG